MTKRLDESTRHPLSSGAPATTQQPPPTRAAPTIGAVATDDDLAEASARGIERPGRKRLPAKLTTGAANVTAEGALAPTPAAPTPAAPRKPKAGAKTARPQDSKGLDDDLKPRRVLGDLNQVVREALGRARSRAEQLGASPVAVQTRLRRADEALTRSLTPILEKGRVSDLAELRAASQALQELSRELATFRLDEPQTWRAIGEARDALLAAAAKGYELELEPVSKASGFFAGERRLNGLVVASQSGEPLGDEQRVVAFELRELCYELEHSRFERHVFGAVAMDANALEVGRLYERMLRAGFGVGSEPAVSAPGGGREVRYLSDVLDKVDQALHGQSVSFAAPGLSLASGAQGSVSTPTAGSLPNAPSVRPFAAGNAGARVDAGAATGNLVRFDLGLREVGQRAPFDIARGGADFFAAYTPAATGVQRSLSSLLGFQYTISTQDAALLNAAVQGALGQLPPGYAALIGATVPTQVAPGATVATASEYTLATPKLLHEGTTRVLLPAGTRIAEEADGVVIAGPGLEITYGSDRARTIVASDAELRLGGQSQLDLLEAGGLEIAGGGSKVGLTGARLEVDRGAESAVIRADRAVVDYSARGGGIAELAGVRFEQVGATSTALGAEQLTYRRGDQHAAVTNLEAASTRGPTSASVAASTGTLELQRGTAGLHADSMRLELTREGSTRGLEFAARGLQIGSGETRLAVDEARLSHVTTPTGSRLHVTTQQTTLAHGAGRFTAAGPMSLDVIADAAGQPQRVELTGSGLAYTDGRGASLTSAAGALTMEYGAAGTVERVAGTLGETHFADGRRRVDLLGTGELGVRLAPDGSLGSVTGRVATGELTFADGGRSGTIGAGTTVGLDYAPQGSLRRLELTGGQGSFSDAGGRWRLGGSGGLVTWDDQGRLQSAAVSVGSLAGSLNNGAQIDGSGAKIALTASEGVLRHGELEAATLSHRDHVGTLTELREAKAVVDWNEDGTLGRAGTLFGAARFTSAGGDVFSGTGLTLAVGAENNRPRSLVFTGETLGLVTRSGALDATGATVDAAFDDRGCLCRAELSAQALRYAGTSANGRELSVDIAGGVGASLLVGADGSQTLGFAAADGRVTQRGNSVRFEQIERLSLATDSAGRVQGLDFGSKGLLSFERSDAAGSVRDLRLSLQSGESLTGSFSDASLDLTGQGLNARLSGANFGSSRTETWFHLDRAELAKLDLAKKLKVEGTLEALDVRVERATGDRLQSLDVQLKSLELQGTKHADLFIHSPTSGDRFRLHLGMDEHGNELRELFLRIPDGGEARVTTDKLSAVLGPQSLAVHYDPPGGGQTQGRLRLVGQGIDADVSSEKTRVKVGGVDAQLWLDPVQGLVIEQLAGRVEATRGSQRAVLSVGDIHNLAVRMQEYSGATRGFALVLAPAHEGSTNLTASLRSGSYGVEFANLGGLAAYGTVSRNQAALSVGDPTRRGNIKAELGPLSAEGSRVGLFAQFFSPTASKVLSETTRHVSSMVTALSPAPADRAAIIPGLYLHENTLEVGRLSRGLDANLTLRLPDSGFAEPTLRWRGTRELDRSAWGVEGTVSYVGEQRMLAVTAGLRPYSSLDVRTMGDVRMEGTALPRHVNVPTAIDATVTYGQKQGRDVTWAASAGGFVAADGWDANGVKQPAQGAHAELAVTKQTGDLRVSGVLGVTAMQSGDFRDKGVFVGLRVSGW